MKAQILLLLTAIYFITSCVSVPSSTEQVLQLAGDNRAELERVVAHYDSLGDQQKKDAAILLIGNMASQVHYAGKALDLFNEQVCGNDTTQINDNDKNEALKKLIGRYGNITPSRLQKVWDCRTTDAACLINNIDCAFASRCMTPAYADTSWKSFCEYVLPYKVGNENPEIYRQRYSEQLRTNIDTSKTIEELLISLNQEFTYRRMVRSSQNMWNVSASLSVSQMEKARIGSCKHLTEYAAAVMRACGLPVGIDHAIWNNRSQGHSWNFMMMADGTSYPFDAFGRGRYKMEYKPAKVFRKSFYQDTDRHGLLADIPVGLQNSDEKDVTDLYVKTTDLKVHVPDRRGHKHAVVCGFDNARWMPVHYGEISKDTVVFTNLANDGIYLAALWHEGKVVPVGEPFIIHEDGSIIRFKADKDSTISMTLKRKYPRLARIGMFALRMKDIQFEGANSLDFKKPTVLIHDRCIPVDFQDTTLTPPSKPFKYVRACPNFRRDGDIAEVEFYGKESADAPEMKLEGKIIADCEYANETNTAEKAFDGDASTFFSKKRETEGWIGMAFDKPYIITRIRYCPRSDTNFIEIGDTYELCYWSDGRWNSHAKKKATANSISFDDVPANTCYILHDLTKGKEERIFTYENGKQVWW